MARPWAMYSKSFIGEAQRQVLQCPSAVQTFVWYGARTTSNSG